MKTQSAFLKNLTFGFCFALLGLSGVVATEATTALPANEGATLSTTPSATANPASAAPTPYPLTICIVSGDKLGGMGPDALYNYNGEEIHFCCKNCIKDFQKDPEKYVSRLHEAVAKQKVRAF